MLLAARAIISSIAGRPGFVAGIFTNRFGRSISRVEAPRLGDRPSVSSGERSGRPRSRRSRPGPCPSSQIGRGAHRRRRRRPARPSARKISFGSSTWARAGANLLVVGDRPARSPSGRWSGSRCTPTTASSSHQPLELAGLSISRDRKSIQTRLAERRELVSRESDICFSLLDFLDLLQPGRRTRSPPSKRACKKARIEVDGRVLGADDLRAEAEHVHVVVLDALVR